MRRGWAVIAFCVFALGFPISAPPGADPFSRGMHDLGLALFGFGSLCLVVLPVAPWVHVRLSARGR